MVARGCCGVCGHMADDEDVNLPVFAGPGLLGLYPQGRGDSLPTPIILVLQPPQVDPSRPQVSFGLGQFLARHSVVIRVQP